MTRLLIFLAAFAMLIGLPPTAHAQQPSTVGNILDRGGKKMTKEEVQKLYSGATVSGSQAGIPEVTFQNKYMVDGSVLGNSWRKGAFLAPVAGAWHTNDEGQLCNNLVAKGTVNYCVYYFTLDSHYYAAMTDDRSAPVYERQFTR